MKKKSLKQEVYFSNVLLSSAKDSRRFVSRLHRKIMPIAFVWMKYNQTSQSRNHMITGIFDQGFFDLNLKMPINLILEKKMFIVWIYSPQISLNFNLNCKEVQKNIIKSRHLV